MVHSSPDHRDPASSRFLQERSRSSDEGINLDRFCGKHVPSRFVQVSCSSVRQRIDEALTTKIRGVEVPVEIHSGAVFLTFIRLRLVSGSLRPVFLPFSIHAHRIRITVRIHTGENAPLEVIDHPTHLEIATNHRRMFPRSSLNKSP